MDFFAIAILALGALVGISEAFRAGEDDPNWDLRWSGLDPEHGRWLAAMSTSHKWLATLEDPLERELATGFARRERRRLAYLDLMVSALLVFGLALELGGLLPHSALTFAISLYFLARAVFLFARHQQIRRRLSERSDSEAAPPARRPRPRPPEAETPS